MTTQAQVPLLSDPAWSLDRDLRRAAADLGEREVRFLVQRYYAMQDDRKRTAQQRDAAADAEEPNLIMRRLFNDNSRMEKNIRYALTRWGQDDPRCQWANTIPGIGPVLAAGLVAHTHMEHCPTVGHLWAFAGLDPTKVWGKGQKRPFNANLKVLCWKIGESFVKVKNKDNDIYGHIYADRRAWEGERNVQGAYAEQAAAMVVKVPKHAQVETYKKGLLPDSHLHSRAKRYATKLFLAHWHHVCHVIEFGTPPPFPYILTHSPLGEHVHYLAPPNWPMVNAAPGYPVQGDNQSK
jgi:hypothetical protein